MSDFWRLVDKGGNCWVWHGRQNQFGYGVFSLRGRDMFVHRLSYEFSIGPVPDGMVIRHICTNKLCVRPDHLAIGVQRENVKDTVTSGRWGVPRKLDWSKAQRIRRLYRRGMTQTLLASRYEVSQMTISLIVNNRSWLERGRSPRPEYLRILEARARRRQATEVRRLLVWLRKRGWFAVKLEGSRATEVLAARNGCVLLIDIQTSDLSLGDRKGAFKAGTRAVGAERAGVMVVRAESIPVGEPRFFLFSTGEEIPRKWFEGRPKMAVFADSQQERELACLTSNV